MHKIKIGDVFIEHEKENLCKMLRIYIITDFINKEKVKTICIHLNAKGQVTERIDYKHNIKRQMNKFNLVADYFTARRYMEFAIKYMQHAIPEFIDITMENL